MARGINRAYAVAKSYSEFSANGTKKRCIFLSHATADKKAVIEIGKYIMKAGIDIYLDINDADLQRAVRERNDQEIVDSIEQGISKSTDMFCIVSEQTKKSWWVGFEIGYGKKSSAKVSTVLLENVSDIPSYLKVTNVIEDIYDLNKELEKSNAERVNKSMYSFSSAEGYLEYNESGHPLSRYVKPYRGIV